MLFDLGHETKVVVGDAVEVVVVAVLLSVFVVVEDTTNFAPQIPALETAAPRLDFR